MPGLVAAVLSPRGRTVRAAGLADVAAKRPMTAEHGFRLGGASMLFLSVIAHRLASEKQLALDGPLSKLLPPGALSGLDGAASASLKRVLQQAAGIDDYLFSAPFYAELRGTPAKRFQPGDLLAAAVREARSPERAAPPQPGAFLAAATNAVIAAMAIEAATRQPLDQVLQEKLARPAGMRMTRLPSPGAAAAATPEMARPYWDFLGDGKLRDASTAAASGALGPGGIVSTAADLLAFADALFRRETLLPRRTVEDMATGGTLEYGVGMEVAETPWGLALGHSGTAFGYSAELYFLAEVDTVVVVLANGEATGEMAWSLMETWR
ncbi:MAG: beta-lactamase family protein [Alphaproteobacteria bacterium]|nr:beta-lactamase family protein [Alphaproteobacteria bacterium]